MTDFEKEKFQVIRNAIDPAVANFVYNEFELIKTVGYVVENKDSVLDPYAFKDDWVEKCFSFYSPFCFETLLLMLKDKISSIANTELLPCYSFGRIYYKGSDLLHHKDREACEVSATINIFNSGDPWDIWFKKLDGTDVAIKLYPGDMIVYKGSELEHWRDTNPTDKVAQVFLHYVQKDGKHSNQIYDGRKFLGLPGVPKIF